MYDSDLRFRHEYQEAINDHTHRMGGAAAQGGGATAWRGRSIREGIEAATKQSRTPNESEGGRGGLQGESGDHARQADEAGGSPQSPSQIAKS